MQIQLRPHQERAVAAMLEHVKGQVIVPTGGGKTLKMFYDALREFQSENADSRGIELLDVLDECMSKAQ